MCACELQHDLAVHCCKPLKPLTVLLLAVAGNYIEINGEDGFLACSENVDVNTELGLIWRVYAPFFSTVFLSASFQKEQDERKKS